MTDVVVKRSLAGHVHGRVKAEQCLVCEAKAGVRGLCIRHYHQFLRRQKERGAEEKQAAFEEECIREGKILPVYQVHKIKRENPFAVEG